jgi:hypothetical protein
MSIVRVGLSENPKYGEGWDAIFKKDKDAKPAQEESGEAKEQSQETGKKESAPKKPKSKKS